MDFFFVFTEWARLDFCLEGLMQQSLNRKHFLRLEQKLIVLSVFLLEELSVRRLRDR